MEYRIDDAGNGNQFLHIHYDRWEPDGRWPSVKVGNVVSFPDVPGVWKITQHNMRYSNAREAHTIYVTAISHTMPEPKRNEGMNYSTAIFLVNDKVRAVRGIYEAWDEKSGQRQPASTVFKTFDQSIKVGDYVLVPSSTRHKMTVNKIVEVDVEPDLETSTEMSWIIGVIDFPAYEAVLAEEAKMIKLMKDAEKADRVKKLREKVIAHVDETKLAALAIAKRADVDDTIEEVPATTKPD